MIELKVSGIADDLTKNISNAISRISAKNIKSINILSGIDDNILSGNIVKAISGAAFDGITIIDNVGTSIMAQRASGRFGGLANVIASNLIQPSKNSTDKVEATLSPTSAMVVSFDSTKFKNMPKCPEEGRIVFIICNDKLIEHTVMDIMDLVPGNECMPNNFITVKSHDENGATRLVRFADIFEPISHESVYDGIEDSKMKVRFYANESYDIKPEVQKVFIDKVISMSVEMALGIQADTCLDIVNKLKSLGLVKYHRAKYNVGGNEYRGIAAISICNLICFLPSVLNANEPDHLISSIINHEEFGMDSNIGSINDKIKSIHNNAWTVANQSVKNSISSEIVRNEKEILNKKRQMAQDKNFIDMTSKEVEVMKRSIDKFDVNLTSTIKDINGGNSYITSVSMLSDRMVFVTKPIKLVHAGESHDIGRYSISILIPSSSSDRRFDQRSIKISSIDGMRFDRYHHPHIADDVCWGNISDDVRKLLSSGQWDVLFAQIYAHLTSYNPADKYIGLNQWLKKTYDETESDSEVECESCGDIIGSGDSSEFGGRSYCESCYNERFTYCESCDNTVRTGDSNYVDDLEVSMCNECIDNNTRSCEKCERVMYAEDSVDFRGETYCSKCKKEVEEEDEQKKEEEVTPIEA